MTVPVPDPTKLTTDAVTAASNMWRRELAAAREVTATRLAAMDGATELRLGRFERLWPAEVEKMIGHQNQIHNLDIQTINLRFTERDVRTEQAAQSSQKALDAALLAAAALVAQQNEANARAAEKVELSTTKQIDAILILIKTGLDATDAKITDLKERLASGDGSMQGLDASNAKIRSTITIAISLAVLAISIIVLVANGLRV